MDFDDPLDEAEAEARTLNASGDRIAAAVERLEDTRLVCRRDAHAVVGDRDAHLARRSFAALTPIQPPAAPYLIALPIRF